MLTWPLAHDTHYPLEDKDKECNDMPFVCIDYWHVYANQLQSTNVVIVRFVCSSDPLIQFCTAMLQL